MTIDKRISYEMQGGKKPARNYLGKQKTVSNVPVKWKSGPDAPSTELAYITKAEKDLLLKKNLHGSLKNGPNTGPDNIMSLDSQGDYTRDRSDRGIQRGGGSRQDRDRREQHMRDLLTGQKNIGQTTKTGPKTRKYAVPEYVKVKQKDGTYKDKYIGSGYKSYGTPSFFGNLFSRGAPGYRGIKGMPAFWGKPKFETRGVPGQEGFGYYSDYEKFGDTRDPVPLGIMGLIANAINKFKKPKDMTEFNKLGLFGEVPEDFNRNRNISTDMGDSVWSDGTFTWGGKKPPASKQYYGIGPVPPSDPFANPIGPRSVNVPGKYEQAETDYWSNKIIGPNGVVIDTDTGMEVQDTPEENINKKGFADTITEKLTNIETKIPDWIRWGSGTTPYIPKGTSIGDAFKGWELIGKSFADEDVMKTNPIYQWAENIGEKGIRQSISDFFFSPAAAAEPISSYDQNVANWRNENNMNAIPVGNYAENAVAHQLFGGNINTAFDDLSPLQQSQVLDAIGAYGTTSLGTLGVKDGGRIGYANGGLASLFNRRG